MSAPKLKGVDFISINTDKKTIEKSDAKTALLLGEEITHGLGAGGNPEVGRSVADKEREFISELLIDTDMVFIVAGMGGGTGTGVTPVITKIAKEMDVLTVVIVTKPFAFEGEQRMRYAEEGITELLDLADTLIVVSNQKLIDVSDEYSNMRDTFHKVDDVLFQGLKGILDLITYSSYINVEFSEIKLLLSGGGVAMMGFGIASGENRAYRAVEAAVMSPLMDKSDILDAQGVLVNVTASEDSLSMAEYDEVMNTIYNMVGEDANINCGVVFDDTMLEDLKVTVVATGIGGDTKKGAKQRSYSNNMGSISFIVPENMDAKRVAELIDHLSNAYRSISGDSLIIEKATNLPPFGSSSFEASQLKRVSHG